MTGSLTGKVSSVESVDGSHCHRDGGTFDIDVSLETGSEITRSEHGTVTMVT